MSKIHCLDTKLDWRDTEREGSMVTSHCQILSCQHRQDLEGYHHLFILPHLPPPPFPRLSPPSPIVLPLGLVWMQIMEEGERRKVVESEGRLGCEVLPPNPAYAGKTQISYGGDTMNPLLPSPTYSILYPNKGFWSLSSPSPSFPLNFSYPNKPLKEI